MQSPNAPELVYLPDELLENIIDRVESESLVQLSMTCRRLHFLALPIVFARADIHDTRSFYLHDPPAHILRALRLALFVENVESIGISFSTHDDRILPYARELHRLISRLPSMKRFYLNFLYSYPSPTVPDPAWQREFICLLNLIVNRSCTLLSVSGGNEILDPGVDASAIRAQSRSIINSVDLRFRSLLWRINRAVRFVIPSNLKRLGGRGHHYGLREFRAVSIILIQPPFLIWTISILQNNSRTLTAVSFKTNDAMTNTWQDILSNIALPFLSKFEMTSSLGFEHGTIPFSSILSFLTRHPSIVNLELRTVTRPTSHHQPRKLLPALETLRADPWFTVWLLNREKDFEHLTSVGLVSEVYTLSRAFDYNTFDGVLGRIPRSAPHVATLYISFRPEAGVVEWLDKYVSQEDSPIAALKSVTTLNLLQSWTHMWRREVMALIPQFVARFPGLQGFTYASPPPGVKRATQTPFIEEIKRVCPGVTVDLGFLADLDTSSQASIDTQEIP